MWVKQIAWFRGEGNTSLVLVMGGGVVKPIIELMMGCGGVWAAQAPSVEGWAVWVLALRR